MALSMHNRAISTFGKEENKKQKVTEVAKLSDNTKATQGQIVRSYPGMTQRPPLSLLPRHPSQRSIVGP